MLYTFGVHFPAIVITMWGSITGLAAVSYALCVWRSAVLPRWTAYLAVLCLIVCVGSTAAVFIGTGPFSLEGAFTAFAPAVSTVAWYLGAAIALIRTPTHLASAAT